MSPSSARRRHAANRDTESKSPVLKGAFLLQLLAEYERDAAVRARAR